MDGEFKMETDNKSKDKTNYRYKDTYQEIKGDFLEGSKYLGKIFSHIFDDFSENISGHVKEAGKKVKNYFSSSSKGQQEKKDI